MKTTKYAILLLFVFIIAMPLCAVEPANFNGEWTFNKNKSKFDDGGDRFVPVSIKITHDDSVMSLERTYQRQYKSDLIDTLRFTLDGKENHSIFWSSPRVVSAQWTNGKKSLTIKTTMTFDHDGEEHMMLSTDIWSLLNDGAELSRDFTIDGPWGEMKAIYVFVNTSFAVNQL
jgi:hypothetical protein